MKFWLSGIFIAVVLVLVVLFGSQVPPILMAHSSKVGRVVDAETGQGMPDTYVVATAVFSAQGLIAGSANEALCRVVAKTDSDGRFRIPSTWSKARYAMPFLQPSEKWLVTAIKPGYVVVGDEDSLYAWNKDGSPQLVPSSIVFTPIAHWSGFGVDILPIQLQKTSLSSKQALIYFSKLSSLGMRNKFNESPENIELKRSAYTIFRPYVCALDKDVILDQYEALAYESVAMNSIRFTRNLMNFEPRAIGEGAGSFMFHAGNICRALRGEGT